MSVHVQCPACQRRCELNESLLGKAVRCPGCQEVFTAAEAPATEGIHSGPVPSRPARLPPSIADTDEPRRSAVRRSSPIALWVVGGLAAALVLVCGFSVLAGGLAWFLWSREPVPLAGVAAVAEPAQAVDGRAPPAQEGGGNAAPQWTLELQKMKAPEQPLAGKVMGADFRLDRCQLVNTGLDLWSGQDWIHIFLTVRPGQNVYEFAANNGFEPGRPAIHLHCRTGAAVHTNGYAMRLEFGAEKNGMTPAKLYLCLPDAGRSCIAGTFTLNVGPQAGPGFR
jgi:hypothetical protein